MKSLVIAFMLLGSQISLGEAVPEQVEIASLEVNGSGCPRGSVYESVAADRKAFTLYFSEYNAELGPGISRRFNRQSCQLTVMLNHPKGWRYRLIQFEYRSYADLDEGVVGTFKSQYYFQAEPNSLDFSTSFEGPMADDLFFGEAVSPTEAYWSSCELQRAINIKTSIQLRLKQGTSNDSTGVIGTDSIDGTIGGQTWRLEWERC
ncbi:MAG: DUF4360 domain-containing protein [Pseudobacteriovorax sp.]|nr:DUF4360 domain-containing protein [Pseudobacteriovorax sp.]